MTFYWPRVRKDDGALFSVVLISNFLTGSSTDVGELLIKTILLITCGGYVAKYEDLIGKKFNMLYVVGLSGTKLNKQPGWQCKCDCGGEKIVTRYHLTKGMVKSCGCLARHTKESFEVDSRKIHEDFYDYSLVEYTHYTDFVIIICPVHGKFDQKVSVHLAGSGCQKCAGILQGAPHLLSKEDFDEQAKALRNDFTYDINEYKKATKHINFTCKVHGTVHRQKPSSYLEGLVACKACRGLIHDLESFIAKANEIHNYKYDYSLVEFKGSKKKVNIICPVGHIFPQTPHNHTAGKHGCPTCGACGFDPQKDSWIYVLAEEGMSKIGITNRSAKIRAKAINAKASLNFQVAASYKVEGYFCSDLETMLLQKYRKSHNNPEISFDGCTECFIGLSSEEIKLDIIKGIAEHDRTSSYWAM